MRRTAVLFAGVLLAGCSASGGSEGLAPSTGPERTTTTTVSEAATAAGYTIRSLGGTRLSVTAGTGAPIAFDGAATQRPAGWPTDLEMMTIPGPSMQPAIPPKGRILVDRDASAARSATRGQVVLAETPASLDSSIVEVVRRVVAVGGERIVVRGGKVTIDGKVVDEPYTAGTVTNANPQCGDDAPPGLGGAGFVVSEDSVFVLGDNRVNSVDSRCYGEVPRRSLTALVLYEVAPTSAVGPL